MAYIIFGIIILIAVILMIVNKNYLLYYFCFLYPILPEYLAINISDSLPLFTASRILLIILIVSLILKSPKIKLLKKLGSFKSVLFIFFLCETLVFLAHLQNVDAIKSYINIIIENIVLLLVLYNLIDSKEKLYKCITVLCFAAFFVFFMGVLEPVTKINLASTYLNTGERANMLMSTYERYGSIRATFSFGHSIALAVYCVAMLPLIMYKMNETNKKIYFICYELGFACLIMTMARGTILVFAVVFVFSLLIIGKKQRRELIKFIVITMLIAFIAVLFIPEVFSIVKTTVLACFNALGANFDINNSSGNEKAILSRTSQFSMLSQVLPNFPLFGGGTGYIFKNNVYINTGERVFKAVSIDMNYLSWLINKGIVGFFGNVILYISLLKITWKNKRNDKNSISLTFFLSFLSIFMAYFTVAELTTGSILWILISLYVCYNKLKIEEKEG